MCVAAAAAPVLINSVGANVFAGLSSSALFSASTLSTIATGASALMSGLGYVMQGQQQQAQAKANANIAEANASIADAKARDAEFRGRLDRQQIAIQEEGLRGTGRTGYASGNVELGSGSPVDWEMDLTERAAADKRMSKYNEKVEVWGEKNSARSGRYQASMYRRSGANSATSGYIGGATSLLAGAGTVADKYYTYKN